MNAVMTSLHSRPLAWPLARALALACLTSAGAAATLEGAASAAQPAGAATTPTVPVPASAKAQNGLDATSSATPSGAGGTKAPAPTVSATTPTTTYAPSAATPLPSTTPAATTPGAPAAGTPAPGAPPTAAQPATPARTGTTAKKGDGALSAGAIAIAALAALLVLACAAWGIARQRAFEPHWLLSLRHASAEAGFRASATWSEFADWARLGH